MVPVAAAAEVVAPTRCPWVILLVTSLNHPFSSTAVAQILGLGDPFKNDGIPYAFTLNLPKYLKACINLQTRVLWWNPANTATMIKMVLVLWSPLVLVASRSRKNALEHL